jgi:hypothetical protein
MMSLPASQQRALARIEQTLVAEDVALGLRFEVFARLTRDDAMPWTEQVPGRRHRFRRPAMMVPLIVIGLVGLLAASWLLPNRQDCPPGSMAAARNTSSASPAARCHPGPSARLGQIPMR